MRLIGVMKVMTAVTVIIQVGVGVLADSRSGEEINWQVISNGGKKGASDNYQLSGTVSQTAVGAGNSDNYGCGHGYWQDFGGSGCCENRGDIDHTGDPPIDIADLVYMVNWMFQSGPEPPCTDEADVDASGGLAPVDIADLVYMVNYMFQGGPAPVECP